MNNRLAAEGLVLYKLAAVTEQEVPGPQLEYPPAEKTPASAPAARKWLGNVLSYGAGMGIGAGLGGLTEYGLSRIPAVSPFARGAATIGATAMGTLGGVMLMEALRRMKEREDLASRNRT